MSTSGEHTIDTEGPHGDLPAYNVSAEKSDNLVRINFAGVTIADSAQPILYRESRLPPVYYFPRNGVRMDLLKRTRHRSHCPFKGNATYWSIQVGDTKVENCVWSYESPLEGMSRSMLKS